ncbi:hypothetical protein GEMRC1_011540 [Eukaryota sp. GEM-RC1]
MKYYDIPDIIAAFNPRLASRVCVSSVSTDCLEYIFWTCEEFGLSATVRFHSLYLLNQYLAQLDPSTKEVPVLLKVLTCIQIATKLHETGCLHVSDIVNIINRQKPASFPEVSSKDIIDSEYEVLRVLQYNTSIPSVYPLLEILNYVCHDQLPTSSHYLSSTSILVLVCVLHHDIINSGFLQDIPLVIIASAVFYASLMILDNGHATELFQDFMSSTEIKEISDQVVTHDHIHLQELATKIVKICLD